jgi:hypothetical protein
VIEEGMSSWYNTCDRSRLNSYNMGYYNMLFGSMSWINGKPLVLDEEVEPRVTYVKTGLEDIECKKLVRCAIENVRAQGCM